MPCFLSQTVFPVADCTRVMCLLLTRVNYFWLTRLFMLFYPQNQNCPLVQHWQRLSFTTGSRFGAVHCPAPQAAADAEQKAVPVLCRTVACSSLQKAQLAFCFLQRVKVYLRHCHPTGLLAFCMALLYIRSSTLGAMSSSFVATLF